MEIQVQSRGFCLTEALYEHVTSRAQHALGHHARRVRRVAVRLFDANGPRGGLDKHCAIRVHLDEVPVVVIDDCDEDLYAAVDRATQRASIAVDRKLTRRRDWSRGGRPRAGRGIDSIETDWPAGGVPGESGQDRADDAHRSLEVEH
ncbi:MAG: HPF/RaiA family ribosome-associated protein [Betaproteobacteria bacterium]|nr:HPF/RaiA family ribosome-associated protein [Betaproteobacteria bacterium]